MSLDDKELTTARLLERQMLQERFLLTCGCEVESKYGHPTQRGWRLVSGYISACPPHNKCRTSLEKEKQWGWAHGPFVPKWRDEYGLWLSTDEWHENTRSAEHGVFEYKGFSYLVLVGYLGTPVVLGEEKGPKMSGRVICLELGTGKTFPAPVSEELLRRFGWTKLEG